MSDAEPKATAEWVLLGQAGIPKPEIDRQVETLCHSPAFDDRDKARELLRYLVDEAVAGRVPSVVEIARGAFGRKDFDSSDPYVRSVAGKLRESLTRHYDEHAKPGEIQFKLPTGQYFILAPRARAVHHEPAPFVRPDNRPVASILEPVQNAEVYQRVTVKGQIDYLSLDLRAWLVVGTPVGDNYPQCRVSRNSPEWEHEVRIGLLQWGSNEDAEYEIKLVAADADGDSEFYQYLKSGRDGFGPLLPTDSLVLDAKMVTRRDLRPKQ
jgi:hypothetical protein